MRSRCQVCDQDMMGVSGHAGAAHCTTECRDLERKHGREEARRKKKKLERWREFNKPSR